MKKIAGLIFVIAFLIGCGPSAEEKQQQEGLIRDDQNTSENSVKDTRKLIKDASIRFRTKDNNETYDFIKKSVKKYNAYISEENNFNYSSETGYDLIIRVPTDKFEGLLDFIQKNANIKELDNKSTKIEDVTEEFVDIEARIRIKKESEQKLLDLLKQAKNLTETLEIQKQLTELRSDIESIEGRLKYLNDQVNYSTIHLSFYENIKYSKRFFADFIDAFKNGWQIFLHLITLITYLWVVFVAALILIWGLNYFGKYRKRIRQEKIKEAAEKDLESKSSNSD